MSQKPKKKSKIIKFLIKGLAALLVLILIVAVALFIYLNSKKNEISEDLLKSVNKELKGDFSVSGISLGSLYSYPNLEVSVKGLKFHAPKGPLAHGELILEVKHFKFKTDLSNILLKHIQIQDVYIKGATLYVERDSLERMVIAEGFRPVKSAAEAADSTQLKIVIKNIQIEASEVVILDQKSNLSLPFRLDHVKGTFELKNNLISGIAAIDLLPLEFQQTEAFLLNEHPINMKVKYSVDLDKSLVMIKGRELFIGDEHFSMNYNYNFTERPHMDLQMSSLDTGVDLSTLFVKQNDSIVDNKKIDLLGRGQFRTNLRWNPDSEKPFFEAFEADFVLDGRDLKIYGIDIDKVIEKFKRSQEFNLADVSAVMFAGPAGLAVTKGTDFARLAFTKAGDSTEIKHFLSDWRMKNGVLRAEDVALSTNNNLISTSGWYNMPKDSLDFKISVLDKRGCELVGQRVYGDAKEPAYGKVKILKTFLGPVTNFFRNIGIAKCDTLYFGQVAHPKKELEKK